MVNGKLISNGISSVQSIPHTPFGDINMIRNMSSLYCHCNTQETRMWALLTCVSVSFKQQEWCTLVWWSQQPGRRAPSTLIWGEDHQLHTSCYVLPFTATITKQQSRISLTFSIWSFILCCLVKLYLRDQGQSVSLFIAKCMNPCFFLKERGTHSISLQSMKKQLHFSLIEAIMHKFTSTHM